MRGRSALNGYTLARNASANDERERVRLPADYQQHIVDRYLSAGVPLLDANSGFEPATFDDEVFARWAPILKGPWRFGFDEATEGENVARAFRILKDIPPRRKQVYTMIGHEPFVVCMDRIHRVIAAGGEPYVQPFIKLNSLTKAPAIRHDWTPQRLRRVQRGADRPHLAEGALRRISCVGQDWRVQSLRYQRAIAIRGRPMKRRNMDGIPKTTLSFGKGYQSLCAAPSPPRHRHLYPSPGRDRLCRRLRP